MYQDATSTRQTPIIDPLFHPSSINTRQIRYITARIGPEDYYTVDAKMKKKKKKKKRKREKYRSVPPVRFHTPINSFDCCTRSLDIHPADKNLAQELQPRHERA